MNGPLVLIEWEDSRQPTSAWMRGSDLPDFSAVRCKTVGWLVHEDEKVLALAQNLGDIDDPEDWQASGIMQIPVRCVVSRGVLSEA